LAVAEKLLSRGHRVRLLVSEKTVDQVALGALTSAYSRSTGALTVTPISAIGYTGLRHSMTFCYRLAQAINTCAVEFTASQPDVVLGMGGFTSAPAVLAARWRGVPSLIHESNAVPGKANAWVGRFANRVALGLGVSGSDGSLQWSAVDLNGGVLASPVNFATSPAIAAVLRDQSKPPAYHVYLAWEEENHGVL
jgi:UDP-N-acetylglucosamine:LPS N-acetylglucosamine transferase